MKVTSNNINNPLKSEGSGSLKSSSDMKSKSSGENSISDIDFSTSAKVGLSEKAQDAKKAYEIAKGGSEVDEARVAKFQALIDSGNYKVDSEALADKMVDEHLNFAQDDE